MCIETDPFFRPSGYAEKIREYLEPKGYKIVAQKGRNSWYTHKDFIPFARPGLSVDCYRGLTFLKAKEEQPACKGYEDLE